MKISPLGVGGAFTKAFYHNNYIMHLDEKLLLIDCGTTLRFSLNEAGYEYRDIDYVYISHLHFDHVGGLEELVLQRHWNFENGKLNPKRTRIILHEKLLSSLISLLSHGLHNDGKTVTDYCDFITLKDGEWWNIGQFSITIFDTSNCHVDDMISSGFKIRWNNQNIVYTSDIKKLQEGNILNYVDDDTIAIFQDISFIQNDVHATFDEVLNYYPQQFHNKIYCMHYNDNIDQFESKIKEANLKLVKMRQPIEF